MIDTDHPSLQSIQLDSRALQGMPQGKSVDVFSLLTMLSFNRMIIYECVWIFHILHLSIPKDIFFSIIV